MHCRKISGKFKFRGHSPPGCAPPNVALSYDVGKSAQAVWFQRRLFVCLFVCQHDNFRTSKHRMLKLGGRCIVQKYRPSSNLEVIAHNPVGSCPQKCGAGLRRWKNQRRLSSCMMHTISAGLQMKSPKNVWLAYDPSSHGPQTSFPAVVVSCHSALPTAHPSTPPSQHTVHDVPANSNSVDISVCAYVRYCLCIHHRYNATFGIVFSRV